MKNEKMSPQEFFDIIKGKRHKMDDSTLNLIYGNCMDLASKYIATGQQKGLETLYFHLETIEKERELLTKGIDTYILRDDLDEYITDVATEVKNNTSGVNPVRIIELENYIREIPDEIVETIKETKNLFTNMYVLFTDYTGADTRKVDSTRKEKDPILFGVFSKKTSGRATVSERFYFLGDWIDEYCDLTLDKLVADVDRRHSKKITHSIEKEITLEEIRDAIEGKANASDTYVKPKSIFSKVRSVIKKG